METSPVTKHLDKYIVESLEREKELRPLMLYQGGVTEHRTRSVFAMLRFLRDNDIPKPLRAQEFLSSLPDERHKAGVHAKSIDSGGLIRWLCRLRENPSVYEIDKPLKDYIDWLWDNTASSLKYIRIRRISETAYRSRRNWRVIQSLGPPTEFYPYLPKGMQMESDILAAVHAIVPGHLREDVRADVCQDLIVSLLTGEASLGRLDDYVMKHIQSHRAMYGDAWGNVADSEGHRSKSVSVNTPLGGDNEWLTIEDTLKD